VSRHIAAVRAALLAVLLAAFTLLLIGVETHWGPLHRLDVRVTDSLHRVALRHPGEVTWWKAVSLVLHPDVLRVAFAIVAVVFLVKRRWRQAVFVVAVMAGEAVIESIVKLGVGRARPHFTHPVAQSSGNSFPSGHAMTSMAAFALLILLVVRVVHRTVLRVAVTAVSVIAVALVGYSRIALGVHYVSDVLAGWLLGLAWVVACDWVINRRSVQAADRRDPDRLPGTPAY
jgi:membrane-associated phospholipid phosphatase